MRAALCWLGLLFGASAVGGGVQGGGWGEEVKLPEGSATTPSHHELARKATFVAGQRASVIVTGRDEESPEAPLRVIVTDEKGDVVARDEGAYNLLAVWYPSRDMTVTIRIENPDAHKHAVWVSVK